MLETELPQLKKNKAWTVWCGQSQPTLRPVFEGEYGPAHLTFRERCLFHREVELRDPEGRIIGQRVR
jgi:hypothetical protein